MAARSAKQADSFRKRVIQVLRRIPPGSVATYGDVAAMAGRPRAARAVGNLMRTITLPGLPYHRVVAAGGRVGGYGAFPQLKVSLLAAEGLTIARGRIRQFNRHRIDQAGRQRLRK
ncbi:MAG TPA: MGMT family protein [Vicinamibacterales bacterium]|nr:MGMT family protein [Vicinamibacterales bacterium]